VNYTKKKSITLGVIFCIFILCSLTYHPIVANESLDEKPVSYNYQFEKNNYCGCFEESKGLWPFPIICFTLYHLAVYIVNNDPFGEIGDQMAVEIIVMTATLIGCRWVET
jgi:hypothetical protein